MVQIEALTAKAQADDDFFDLLLKSLQQAQATAQAQLDPALSMPFPGL